MNSLQRRGLINGGIAAAITFLLGTVVVATTQGGGLEAEPVVPSATNSPSPTPKCDPSWELVPSANSPEASATLHGVTAITAAEAWAVGGIGDPAQPSDVMVQRWNGSEWTVVEAPSPGSFINELRSVDASEPNDVWAVGRQSNGFTETPLVLRYDGTSWAEVELPDEFDGVLNDVAAISPTDVWAVGFVGNPAVRLERSLVLHWDGIAWAAVDVQRAVGGGRALLRDVDAVSPTDLWVVGYKQNKPLILRFDGQAWSRSETEVPGTLTAVEAFATSEVWAVGTPIQRFDGQAWTEVATIRGETELADVASVGASDVWAVGARPAKADDSSRVAVARWNGQRWSFVPGPQIGGQDALTAIDALPDGTVLGVGTKDIEAGRKTIAIRGSTCVSVG